MLLHLLTNFEIMKYYENKSRFNGVYSRDNIPNKIKDVISLNEYSDIGTHLIALYVKNNKNITYFDSFGVEYIPNDITKFINRSSSSASQNKIFSGYNHMIQ